MDRAGLASNYQLPILDASNAPVTISARKSRLVSQSDL